MRIQENSRGGGGVEEVNGRPETKGREVGQGWRLESRTNKGEITQQCFIFCNRYWTKRRKQRKKWRKPGM